MDLTHLESRPSKTEVGGYDFFVTMRVCCKDVAPIVEKLGSIAVVKSVFGLHPKLSDPHWFPRTVSDLDQFAFRVLGAGGDLEADHPGFSDPLYLARRNELADIAINYRHGQPIPRVAYTEAETATWYYKAHT